MMTLLTPQDGKWASYISTLSIIGLRYLKKQSVKAMLSKLI